MQKRSVITIALLGSIAASPATAQEPWPAGAFDEPIVHSTGESADADTVAVGDVTGDGRPDALVAAGRTAYELVVFAQQPDRSLAESARLPLRSGSPDELYPAEPTVSLGDLDGDGDLDAAATGDTSVYYQRGGVLQGPIDIGVGTTLDVHLADLDGDGLSELLASSGATGVSVYRRTRSDATFRGGTIKLADGSTPWPTEELEVGDINSDGRTDVVAFVGKMLQLYEARSDGTYAMRLIELPSGSEGIEVADLTGDGADDVVASFGNWARLFSQSGGTVSGTGRDYQSHHYPESLDAADIDGDGRLDLVTIDDYYTELGIWRQQQDGTLAEQGTVALPKGSSDFDPKGLAVGDIDCDGRVDAAIADFSLGLIVVRQAFSGSADCPDPPTGSGASLSDAKLHVRRRQRVGRVRSRGVRAVVVIPSGCRAGVTLRTRRGRLLARKRRGAGRHAVYLRPNRRLTRGATLRVRTRFTCGEAGTRRLRRTVVLV